jgi:hypothetical protein
MDMTTVDIDDLNEILEYNGYSIGFSGDSKKLDKILKDFKQYFINAKGIFVQFRIGTKISLFDITNKIEEINELIDDNTNLLLSIQNDKIVEKDSFHFQILITGINKL